MVIPSLLVMPAFGRLNRDPPRCCGEHSASLMRAIQHVPRESYEFRIEDSPERERGPLADTTYQTSPI